MKKAVNVVLAITIVICIALFITPQKAEAKDTKVAEGVWSTGTEVDVDASASSAPKWLNLLTKGVKVTEPGMICHPFRGGSYHWVGEIRQLKDGNWVKLDTKNEWYPNKEGYFRSCAQAPSAGTYALFGYYNGPQEFFEDGFCSTLIWDMDHSNLKTVPTGTAVTATIISGSSIDIGRTEVSYTDVDGNVTFVFAGATRPFTLKFVESTHGCSNSLTVVP